MESSKRRSIYFISLVFILKYYIKCDDFPKIFQNWPECRTNVSEHFPKISGHFPKIAEDCRRRPKKIRRCFDHTPTNLSLVKGSKHHSSGTDIFTCEDIISSHVRISYRFYQFCYHSLTLACGSCFLHFPSVLKCLSCFITV